MQRYSVAEAGRTISVHVASRGWGMHPIILGSFLEDIMAEGTTSKNDLSCYCYPQEELGSDPWEGRASCQGKAGGSFSLAEFLHWVCFCWEEIAALRRPEREAEISLLQVPNPQRIWGQVRATRFFGGVSGGEL